MSLNAMHYLLTPYSPTLFHYKSKGGIHDINDVLYKVHIFDSIVNLLSR